MALKGLTVNLKLAFHQDVLCQFAGLTLLFTYVRFSRYTQSSFRVVSVTLNVLFSCRIST